MINLKRNLTSYLYKFVFVLSIISLPCFIVNASNARPVPGKVAFVDYTPLKAFEGIYQLKENELLYFKITVADDKLLAKQVDGNQQFVLTRKSEFTFETKDDDGDETLSVTFSKNDAGEIVQALVADKQLWIKVKNYVPVPVKEVTLSPGQLKAFEGKYQFEEKKDVFLQITATADGLLLKQLWDGREINFIAISDLNFLNKQMAFPLKFTKDQDGNIIKVLAFNRDTWDKVKE